MAARSWLSFPSFRLTLFFSTFAFTTSLFAAGNSTCYYPSGLENKGTACNPDAAVSPCCGPGFICLSNGLCTPGPDNQRTYRYKYYRSGCTDSTWESSDCPQLCLGSGDDLDAGEGIQDCGSNSYCCNRPHDCCSQSDEVFTLEEGNVLTTIPYNSQAATATTTSSPAATSASTQLATEEEEKKSKNTSIAIGVGVGMGIGFSAAIVIGIYLLLRRKRRNKKAVLASAAELEDSAPLGSDAPRYVGAISKDVYEAPSEPTELEGDAKAPIPREAQELGDASVYEIGRAPSRGNDNEELLKNEGHPGQYFKEDGVYRHEVSG